MLKGKTAVVTGATSGIGLGIAKALAGEGCNLMLNGMGDAQEVERIRRSISADFGIRAGYCGVDLGKPEEIPRLVDAACSEFGRIDILVNNAGIQYVSPIEKFPTEQWNAVIAVNLSAAFHTIRIALPVMKQQGWGRIINIASVNGLVASIHKAAYVAAKHGLLGLTKVVALETAELNITCNAVCPGLVRTPLVERQIETRAAKSGLDIEAAAIEHVTEKHPSKKFVTVEQVAALAVFLCRDSSASITGAALPVDGGWLAW